MNRNIYSSGAKGAFGGRGMADQRRSVPTFSSRQVQGGAVGPMALAIAYVPSQKFQNLYSPSDALGAGTLFAELNMPYCTGGRR